MGFFCDWSLNYDQRDGTKTKFVGTTFFLRWGYLILAHLDERILRIKVQKHVIGPCPPEQQLTKNSKGERQETDVQKKRGQRYQWSGISAMCRENDGVMEGLSVRRQRNWVQGSTVKYPVESCIHVYLLSPHTAVPCDLTARGAMSCYPPWSPQVSW